MEWLDKTNREVFTWQKQLWKGGNVMPSAGCRLCKSMREAQGKKSVG